MPVQGLPLLQTHQKERIYNLLKTNYKFDKEKLSKNR